VVTIRINALHANLMIRVKKLRVLRLAVLLGFAAAISLPLAARAELVPGGWLDKPKLPPAPPPAAERPPPMAPAPIVRRPVARPHRAPAPRPANAPPSDGGVRF
jgi:hypothetical protein